MSTTIDVERPSTAERETPDHEVVGGAGFGGIGAGITLQRQGIHDFVIVDKWDQVGGTWHVNSYPVVAADIPSFVYSFSYEQRGDWSLSGSHEEYFRECLKRQERKFLFTSTCAGSNTYYIDSKGDSPFRPSMHGEMYWQNRHYNLDVNRYGIGPAVLDDVAANSKENA